MKIGKPGKITCKQNGAIVSLSFDELIEFDQPEFDWETVKPGMAFLDGAGEAVWWIGKGLDAGGSLYAKWEICQAQRHNNSAFVMYCRGDLTRSPEYDGV